MANTNKPTLEDSAMLLVLLVKNYKSQIKVLLLKNGVVVPKEANDEQIAMLTANLLKVSKSFATDLNKFVKNPKVIEVLSIKVSDATKFFGASGYFNSNGGADGFTDTGEPAPGTVTPRGFFAGLNLGALFTQGLNAFSQFDTNKTNVAIANAAGSLNSGGQFGGGFGGNGIPSDTKDLGEAAKEGISTTAIVLISVGGVALLGTIIYFVMRAKK